jgi:hypothetical protein
MAAIITAGTIVAGTDIADGAITVAVQRTGFVGVRSRVAGDVLAGLVSR